MRTTRRFPAAWLALALLLPGNAEASWIGLMCAKLFGRAPESYNWTRRLDAECPVQSQKGVGNCWVQAGVLFFSKIARMDGVLAEDELLSADYYFARAMQDKLREATAPGKRFFPRPTELSDGGDLPILDELIRRHGFVAQADYRLPAVAGAGGGGTYATDPGVRLQFQKDFRSGMDPNAIVKKYFGDLSAVKARVEFDPIRLAKEGVTSLAGKVSHAMPSFEVRGTLQNTDALLDRIRMNIDRGFPVFSSWNLSRRFRDVQGTYGNYIFRDEEARQDSLLHAMAIVGYELERGKVVRVLVQNSWGPAFGQNGLFVADRYFFEKYLMSIQGWY